MTNKNIFDYSHVKSVKAYILTDDANNMMGKIIANFSDNPAGSVCTAQIIIWSDSNFGLKPKIKHYTSEFLKGQTFNAPLIGKAGGYGYDKFSSAVASAIRNNCTEYPAIDFDGAGDGKVREWFKQHLNLNLVSVI